MEWLERLNQAVDYVESNIDGEISYDKAAQIACCSTFHFQRMFSYIAGVPVSEYIRRRRMTMAAMELQSSDIKIIDLAVKYGYDSPTSFNRAFQVIHGMAPSAAREAGVILKAYPRITFHITIKGDAEMDYRIEKKEAFRIVGRKELLEKEIEANFKSVPLMWGRAASDGTVMTLSTMMDSEPKGILGVTAAYGEDWYYYICVASTQETPEGMEEYTVPACTWAVFPGQGSISGLQELEKRAVTEWLPSSGFEYANAPDVEVYLNPDPANAVYEVWLPIVKKEK